jgi:hypothetical protein
MLRLGDDEVLPAAPDHTGLAEHDAELVVGALDPSLRLGDRLLRDDEHVPLLQPARPLDGVAEQHREIVARGHLGHAQERKDAHLHLRAGRAV